jgi:signal transduction histidine kinase
MAGDAVIKPQHISVVPPMAPAPAQPAVALTTARTGGKSAMRSLLLAGVAAVLLLVAGGGYYTVISIRAQQERQRAEVEAQRKADEFAAQQKQAEEEERKAAADAATLARAQEQAARLRAELEARQRAEAEAAASAAAQNAASLRTSLNTIRTLMAQQGRIDYSTVAHDSATGQTWSSTFNAEASNLTVDEQACRIRYHWRTVVNGKVDKDFDTALPFRLATSLTLTSMAEDMTQLAIKAGHNTWGLSVNPQIWVVSLYDADHRQYVADFRDRAMAQSAADTMRQAMKLCH